SHLVESAGMNSTEPLPTFFGYRKNTGAGSCGGATVFANANSAAVDWNGVNGNAEVGVKADLNDGQVTHVCGSVANLQLRGHEDWLAAPDGSTGPGKSVFTMTFQCLSDFPDRSSGATMNL